jgi:hypothetical protein
MNFLEKLPSVGESGKNLNVMSVGVSSLSMVEMIRLFRSRMKDQANIGSVCISKLT